MFDKALQLMTEGRIAFAMIAVVFGVIFNAKKIVEFIDIFKKRRIELLQEASKSTAVSDTLKEHFHNEIEDEYFRLTHKKRMSKKIRELSLTLSKDIDIPFFHFIRASSLLKSDENGLSVAIPTFDNIGYYFNLVFGFSSIMFGAIIVILAGEIDQPSIKDIVTVLTMSAFLILIGVMMISQTFPVHSAKKIESEVLIKCNKQRQSDG